jgi:DNA-binding NtrC family response regulator
MKLPDGDGIDVIPHCRELAPDTPIIAMTAYAVREVAMEALRRGAYDFFTKPLKHTELEVVVARALERRRMQQHITALEASRATGFEEFLGASQSLTRVLEAARRVASSDVTVLIEGESGTGKELLAQAIHRHSSRANAAIVAVNCAAIPEGLLESELFGHERGAFTGAVRTRVGRFELARGGTLFLDEIGDMPPAMQAKILRALEERKIERVGGTRLLDVDVRVIGATNQRLRQLVDAGRFRADLFYRLQGVHLRLPSLRERMEDLPLLVSAFVERAKGRLGRGSVIVSNEALQCLWSYAWPGNVRELQHVLEGAVLLSDGVIRPEHLPPAIHKPAAPSREPAVTRSLDDTMEDIERQMILAALQKAHGVQVQAARLLGTTEKSLGYRIKKFGIQTRAAAAPDGSASSSTA